MQLLSLDEEPGSRRIEMIAGQTIHSLDSGKLLAEKPELDIMLRVAGTTQISEALARVGYKNRGRKVLIALGAATDLRRLERIAEDDPARYVRTVKKGLRGSDLRAIEKAALLGVTRP